MEKSVYNRDSTIIYLTIIDFQNIIEIRRPYVIENYFIKIQNRIIIYNNISRSNDFYKFENPRNAVFIKYFILKKDIFRDRFYFV